jgi:cytochrome c-type biogenesis protein CcmF
MRPGEAAEVGDYLFTFQGIAPAQGPNYRAERGTFTVTRHGRTIAMLFPERRFYNVEGRQTTEAAIHTTWFADLYAVVGESDGNGAVSVRLYHNPLVPWIWAGAIVMALGGAISLSDRRHRVGAPARAALRAAV